ncbi:MAG: NAD-dependent epimerase/dehydratase family protein [Planctomycetaceae bacterium]|nr:NAD-dependent epimerase/dehydratase family protein [Planctomycetaceae bacterium]
MSAKRIVVTGSTGFLGRHLLPILIERYGPDQVAGLSRRDYDLIDPVAVRRMFGERRPDVVVHLAAYSGGIGANREFPADFYYQNTLLTTLMFEEAARNKIGKLIYPMGGCSYPATSKSPISEDQMWQGFPQPESAGYSSAKKMGLVASWAYRRQYGLNSVVVVPGNMYGEYDNFRTSESHVVPAMVRRYFEAGLSGLPVVEMWGTGKPQRDFVYAGDVARAIPWFIENYDSSEPVNLSSGTATPIRELAETIRDLTGYRGDIVWDANKPDGQMVKIFDVKRMHGLGLECPTPLRAGLEKTITWLSRNYSHRGEGIRL